MRYENIYTDYFDRDFIHIDKLDNGYDVNIMLTATDEMIDITNEIRSEQGNMDLVGYNYDNDVYYTFYLMFNVNRKEISIQAECNHGEKDDYVWYELPMTEEEKVNVMFKLIDILTIELDKAWQ